jgi:outer membrane lipoprotein-sorting protein
VQKSLPLALLLLTAAARAQSPTPQSQLLSRLAALHDTASLQANFTCEKRLALLETPLISSGRLWIQRPEKNTEGSGGGVRFSTEKPYISELILTDGKVFARSQHEDEWTKSNQSSRPGLTAVMGELGGWATGDPSKLADLYTVTTAPPTLPPPPNTTPATNPPQAETYLLTPSNKDLAKAVKQITLTLDPTTSTLLFIEITTTQDDTTRYWFSNVQKNPTLPPNIFTPTNLPAPTSQP